MAIKLHKLIELPDDVEQPELIPTSSVGQAFKKARTKKKQTLPEVSKKLCIRKIYLEQLESNSQDELPDMVYTLGFVRSYAQHLGLDADAMVQQYKQDFYRVISVEEEEKAQQEVAAAKKKTPKEPGTLPSRGLIFACLLLLMAIIAFWNALHDGESADLSQDVIAQDAEVASQENADTITDKAVTEETAPENDEEATVVEDAVNGIVVVQDSASDSAEESTEEPVAKPAAEIASKDDAQDSTADAQTDALADTSADLPNDSIVVMATSDTWVEIGDGDNPPVVSKVMKKGDVYTVPAGREDLLLMTGNAAGLDIIVDGQTLTIGRQGEILRNIPLTQKGLLKKYGR